MVLLLFVGVISWYEYSLFGWISSKNMIIVNTWITELEETTLDEHISKWNDNFDKHMDYVFPWEQKDLVSEEKPLVKHIPVKRWQDEFWLDYDFISGSILDKKEYFTEDGTGVEYYLQWYEHYYTFNDFWIIIWINKKNSLDKEYYLKDNENNLFSRYIDDSYDVIYQNWYSNYVQKFKKDPKVQFNEELLVQNNWLSGCIFELYSDQYRPKGLSKNYIIYSMDPDEVEFCDKNANTVIYFVYNPLHKDRYYKVSHVDWCAPSCWVFQYLDLK